MNIIIIKENFNYFQEYVKIYKYAYHAIKKGTQGTVINKPLYHSHKLTKSSKTQKITNLQKEGNLNNILFDSKNLNLLHT